MSSNEKPTATTTAPAMEETEDLPSNIDIYDQLTERLGHLEAMLLNTCGASFESFMSMKPANRDAYLHACFCAATECSELAGELRR